jgi:hypothetical protein
MVGNTFALREATICTKRKARLNLCLIMEVKKWEKALGKH